MHFVHLYYAIFNLQFITDRVNAMKRWRLGNIKGAADTAPCDLVLPGWVIMAIFPSLCSRGMQAKKGPGGDY